MNKIVQKYIFGKKMQFNCCFHVIYQNKIRFLRKNFFLIITINICQTTKSYIIILKIIYDFDLSVLIFMNQS